MQQLTEAVVKGNGHDKAGTTAPVKLCLGAGHSRIPGFLRVDIDPETAPDILMNASDLHERFPKEYPLRSVSEIRAHHILEHFYIKEAFPVLRNWWKTLSAGGRLEIAVPDCGYAARAYAMGAIDHCQFAKIILGGDQVATPYMLHKNVFTAERLERLLFITGFVRIRDIRRQPSELLYEAFKPEDQPCLLP